MDLYDPPSSAETDPNEKLYIQNCEGVLFCISVTSASSLQAVLVEKEKILKEKDLQHLPAAIAVCKCDLETETKVPSSRPNLASRSLTLA